MNAKDYLTQLEKQLFMRVTQDEMQHFMDYYQNYFLEAAEFGKKDEEIIRELGDVEVLVTEILKETKEMHFDLFETNHSLKQIQITLLDLAVKMVYSDEEKVYVSIENYEEKKELLFVEQQGDCLNINQQSRRSLLFKGLLTKQKTPYLLIKIPTTMICQIELKTKDGNIQVDGQEMIAKSDLNLLTHAGKIECRGLMAQQFKAVSYDGRITFKRCKIKDIDVVSYDGRLRFKKVTANKLNAKTKDGRIILEKCWIEFVEAKSNDGRIVIMDSLIDDCHVKTKDGKCIYNVQGSSYGLHLDLLSGDGGVYLNENKLTKSNEIVMDIEPKENQQRYLNAHIRTTCGRIEIFN